MEIAANLTFNKVQFDKETEAHLVLGLTAPVVSVEDKRPRLCIIPLVDVSGSMEGEKLVYAKRSLDKLIGHLSPNDYCGLIDFADDARVIAKPVLCTAEAKDDLKRKVGDLRTRGCTNIADALLKGFDLAKKMDLSNEVILRVILFTDGMANRGPATEPVELVELISSNKETATVSAFGYGDDVRQDMLLDMAKKGNGNYAFVQSPDDALSAFGKELGGLLSTYATNLIIEISPLAGHKITQVVSDVDAEEGDLGQVTIKIPDILSEEVRNLVLAVTLQAQKSAFPRGVNVFEVKAGYDILDANLRKEHKVLDAKAKVQFVKKGEHQEKPDPDLDKVVGLAQLVQEQIKAEEYAKQGDYNMAVQHMNVVADRFSKRGLIGAAALSKGLGKRLRSRGSYTANAAYFASVTRGSTRGMGGTYEVSAAADLADAGVMLSNTSQEATVDSFSADDGTNGTLSINSDPGSADLSWVVNPDSIVDPNLVIAPPITIPEPVEKKAKRKAKPKAKKLSQKSKRW